ncbi:MAG: methionyl-tRNA formyltransferase [Bryobacteraceae bacterium]|nr:methionyl-tRNA formyltransferase [Bryobacteraceae bacterium]
MRVVFLGTPHFAVPSLEALASAGYSIVAVYTQPDRPKGRGRDFAHSPVKQAALALNLDVRQPERIRRPEIVEELRGLSPDVMVVVGYGQIIPQSIIDIPPLGILNVHASLLPEYRGAAPIQWAIADGRRATGVTIMKIDAGLDTGDILLKSETPIGDSETAPELSARLSRDGARLLLRALQGLRDGGIQPEKQNHAAATMARILTREDGKIDWTWTAPTIHNRMRGFTPWPGCYTTFRGQRLHIWKARPIEHPDGRPGEIATRNRDVVVVCGAGTGLVLEEVQLEGKKRMPASAFRNGYPFKEHETLGE